MYEDRSSTELRYRVDTVADDDYCDAPCLELTHFGKAFFGKDGVAYGQHLVDEQDVGIAVHSDGERETHVHTRRIPLDRGIHEIPELREVHHVIESRPGVASRHTE